MPTGDGGIPVRGMESRHRQPEQSALLLAVLIIGHSSLQNAFPLSLFLDFSLFLEKYGLWSAP